jgi:hypothetical protein
MSMVVYEEDGRGKLMSIVPGFYLPLSKWERDWEWDIRDSVLHPVFESTRVDEPPVPQSPVCSYLF